MDVQAIPSQSVIRARESTLNVPADRRIKDVSKRIHKLDPEAAPFTLLLQRGRAETCNEPEFRWPEMELAAKWSQANGASAAGAGTLVVDHARYFGVGDIINVIQAGAGNGLKCRVTGVDVATQTLTIVRAVGTTADADIVDNADIQIIGNAYAEGSPLGLERSHIEAYLSNYVQIFRHQFGVTGTQDATVGYIGKSRPILRAMKSIEHKLDIERTALFGEKAIDASSTNNPRRYTGGAFHFLIDNIQDAGGTWTAAEVWTWLQDVFTHTGASNTRLLLASPLLITVLDRMALTTGNVSVQMPPREKTFGMQITQWTTSHGSFNIVKHRLLDNGLGGGGYGGHGLLVDPSSWRYRYLEGRNTQLRMDVGAKGDDAVTDEYLTECGWEIALSKTQGMVKNVTG